MTGCATASCYLSIICNPFVMHLHCLFCWILSTSYSVSFQGLHSLVSESYHLCDDPHSKHHSRPSSLWVISEPSCSVLDVNEAKVTSKSLSLSSTSCVPLLLITFRKTIPEICIRHPYTSTGHFGGTTIQAPRFHSQRSSGGCSQ